MFAANVVAVIVFVKNIINIVIAFNAVAVFIVFRIIINIINVIKFLLLL